MQHLPLLCAVQNMCCWVQHCFILSCICENGWRIQLKKRISPCFVVFENPCFEHRHWKFEWAAACLRGTRPAWRACLTLGRRQASPGTRPAATSLPNPWGGGKPTRHEASMASLPNPWGGGKPTRHEASVASLPNPWGGGKPTRHEASVASLLKPLNFEFD